ncbi:hypothetical protein PRUPE_3G014900 [Prunus persica]|uniref:Uncharacterized protein n=1 Tax=Prunus persica TaxID=3760 RepID=A0A251PTI1_PRUPE|nr:protein REVEILLE 1 isoform X1 [Prunus persica]ONI14894.1 hypothetical protein PRUPE_3G014900 [Prunus persica]
MVGGLMLSPDMAAAQDQYDGSRSESVLSANNGFSFSASGLQLKDQFSNGNDSAPKARKPYTITKQRERWTEEEHKKFLEALKLYGRAWRKIEEHVGTKTAVQIRSHAQKFFSKVARDSNGSNEISEEPIDIPPPRPKRKPMRPYPRKLVHPVNKETFIVERPTRSASPNLSVSEPENQSPTSVLSVIGSDTLGSADSNTPSRSLSPVSSAADVHGVDLNQSEPPNPSLEESGSTSPAVAENGSLPNVQLSMKLELFPTDNVDASGVSSEEVSARSLKLFGRTVLVTDSHRPSSPTLGTSKSLPSDVKEEKPVQISTPCNFTATESASGSVEHVWDNFPYGVHPGMYFMQFQNQNSNLVEPGSAYPVPWWTLCPKLPFPFIPFHKPQAVKEHFDGNLGDPKEVEKEGSWTGSDAGSVNDEENGDKCLGIETEGKEQEPNSVLQFKASANSAFSELRASPSPGKCRKGFVPYKRCLAERDTSTIASEDRDGKRVDLSL